MSYPLWIRLMVLLLSTIIVFLLIYFWPEPKVVFDSKTDQGNQPSIHVGRDIVAGRDINITNPNYFYLNDKYILDGIMRQGWYISRPPQDLIDNPSQELNIFPVGLANKKLGFVVASSQSANCKVELLYVKLKAYAPCNLRNEYSTVAAFMGLTTSAFYISEDYDVYPIYPLNDNLTQTAWKYQGKDVDEFTVDLTFKAYVLYLININIDYIDLHTNKRKHIETDEFALIDVARGNTGGCLDIKSWFSNDMKQVPLNRRYDEGIPFDIYQLLSSDLGRNPGLMNVFANNISLAIKKDKVRSIVESRPDNTRFASNFKEWTKVLDAK